MKNEHEALEEELLTDQPEADIVPEEDLGDIAAAQSKFKILKKELEQVKSERQEYLDGWQRCKADSVNMRKETLLNAERIASRAKESFIEDLVPVLDGFDMATGSDAWESLDAQWRSGVDQIRNQFLDVLSRNGIERFGKIGDIVDHALHEVVEERDDVAGESATVIRVLRYGYKMGGRVIRAAHVIAKK